LALDQKLVMFSASKRRRLMILKCYTGENIVIEL